MTERTRPPPRPRRKTIKLADIIENTATIDQHDPEFAKVYRKEKEALLAVMTKGDPALYQRALDQLRQFDEARLQQHLSIHSVRVPPEVSDAQAQDT